MKRSHFTATIALGAVLASPLAAQDEKDKAPATEAKPAAETAADKPAAKEDENKVLVRVDGAEITAADVNQQFQARYGNRLASMPPQQQQMMREHALPSIKEELISKTLLLAAAAKENIALDEAKRTEMIKDVTDNLPEDMTVDAFYKQIGMDEASFKEAIGEEVIIGSLLDKKTESVPDATDEETKKFYTENEQQFVQPASVEASHILIKTEGITEEAEKAKKKAEIEDIRKQLVEKKGENFAELAKQHSGCPSSANGGSLGTFGPGQMVPAFDKAAFSQKIGDIGEIVETNFGYHVIMVTEKTEEKKFSYDDMKDRIAEHLEGEKKSPIIKEYMESLRTNAKIEDLSKPAADPAPAPAPPAKPE